jgi:hypothetical protein
MARIRSVHPALFTDEAWVSCSAFARILIVGLWTDADDQGVFEWKPVGLKMKLLPNDAVDVLALLDELAEADIVRAFDVAGRRYGAIRNFQKYQRPKKPNALHPVPADLAEYVNPPKKGSEGDGTGGEVETDEPAPVPPKGGTGGELVGNRPGSGGEKSPQMEDGGGNRREESPPTPPLVGREEIGTEIVDEAIAAYHPTGKAHTKPHLVARAWSAAALAAGGDAALLACIRAFTDEVRKGDAVPGLHKWLTERRWAMYRAEAAPPADQRQAWPGPSAVWDAVVEHADKHLPLRGASAEDYTAAYLLSTTWRDVPTRAVICRSGHAFDRLKSEWGGVFRRLDVEVILQREEVAA